MELTLSRLIAVSHACHGMEEHAVLMALAKTSGGKMQFLGDFEEIARDLEQTPEWVMEVCNRMAGRFFFTPLKIEPYQNRETDECNLDLYGFTLLLPRGMEDA
jgi:hypothetical protein